MKVIVDTSVWSLAIRRKSLSDQPEVDRLAELIDADQPIYLMGIILLEVLRNIKEQPQAQKIRRQLEPFPILDLERSGYIRAAMLGSLCRSKGIQVGTVDILIAQTAIEHDCHLLTTDKDFVEIARNSALKLL